jgi:hypothetical protein
MNQKQRDSKLKKKKKNVDAVRASLLAEKGC